MTLGLYILKLQCMNVVPSLPVYITSWRTERAGASAPTNSGFAHALIVSRILYALPAWGGFLSAELSGKLDALLRRLKRFDYIRDNLKFLELLD